MKSWFLKTVYQDDHCNKFPHAKYSLTCLAVSLSLYQYQCWPLKSNECKPLTTVVDFNMKTICTDKTASNSNSIFVGWSSFSLCRSNLWIKLSTYLNCLHAHVFDGCILQRMLCSKYLIKLLYGLPLYFNMMTSLLASFPGLKRRRKRKGMVSATHACT